MKIDHTICIEEWIIIKAIERGVNTGPPEMIYDFFISPREMQELIANLNGKINKIGDNPVIYLTHGRGMPGPTLRILEFDNFH